MPQNLINRLVLAAALAASVLLAACGNPCKELAQKICSCEDSPTAEQSCLDRVTAEDSNIDVTDAQNDVCAEQLDSCTCNKLKAFDRAACGLAVDDN